MIETLPNPSPKSSKVGLTQREVKGEYGFDKWLLSRWRRRCRVLPSKKLRRWRDRTSGRWLYSREDLDRIKAAMLAEPVDEFHDARGVHWVWVKRIPLNPSTIRWWRTHGCPALGGRKLVPKILFVVSDPTTRRLHERHYYRKIDVDAIAAAPLGRLVTSVDSRFMTAAEAHDRFGFSRDLLKRFAEEPCPLLNDRKIRTDDQTRRYAGGRTGHGYFRKTRVYLVEDLEELDRHRMGRASSRDDDEIDSTQARKLGFRTLSTLTRWHETGCPLLGGAKIWAERRVILTSSGRIQEAWLFHRSELVKIKGRLDAATLPDSQVYTDDEGDWLPYKPAADFVERSPSLIWRWHHEGHVRAQRVRMRLPKNPRGEFVWVFHQGDLRARAKSTSAPLERDGKTGRILPRSRANGNGQPAPDGNGHSSPPSPPPPAASDSRELEDSVKGNRGNETKLRSEETDRVAPQAPTTERLISPGEQVKMLGIPDDWRDQVKRLQVAQRIREKAIRLGFPLVQRRQSKSRGIWVDRHQWQPVAELFGMLLSAKDQNVQQTQKAFGKLAEPGGPGQASFFCENSNCMEFFRSTSPKPVCSKCGGSKLRRFAIQPA